jgi:protein gp37
VFVNSMSDFLLRTPEDRSDALDVMRRCPQHVFQILTKRAELLHLLPPLPGNVWIGVSVERQDFAYRLDHLRAVDASVRFVSAEPLLGPLDLDLSGIGWLIAGGESGPRRRPIDLSWLRSLREQCAVASVPFHLKQIDKVAPIPPDLMIRDGRRRAAGGGGSAWRRRSRRS